MTELPHWEQTPSDLPTATKEIKAALRERIAASGRTVEEVAKESAATIPIGRYGKPEEYGSVVAFLSSDRAAYITGSVIRVDGGMIQSV